MDKSNIIFGRQPVLEALKAGIGLKKIVLAEGVTGSSIKELENYARQQNIPLERGNRKYIDKLASGISHQGVVALGFAYNYVELEEIFSRAQKKGESPFIILMDQVQDPQNLGALIRTAEGAGAHGVVIPSRRSAQVTPAVLKASAGAVAHIPVARVKNLNHLVEELKDRGMWVYGTDSRGLYLYHEVDYRIPLALVIGSEGRGISRLLGEKCDYLVNIPMMGRVDSLNASAAGAVLMYEVLRQRQT